jgi:hypothetical protein
MKLGKWFVSTGIRQRRSGRWWHVLVAVHRKWRVDFVRVAMKPGYSRLYLGPVEIEWSRS